MNEIPANVNTSSDEQITIAMCSIPEREAGMLQVVQNMLPQCDHLDVCLNGYPNDYQHAVLNDPKITVIRQPRDMGPRGKFYMAARVSGYYLTVDDDLNYPSDYAYRMIQGIERYRREAIVGLHGILYCIRNNPAQPATFTMIHCMLEVKADHPVHHLGTGAMAFHTSAFRLDWRKLIPGKIDDQVGWAAQEQRVPMIVLAHPAGYLTDIPGVDNICALKRNTEAKLAAHAREHSRHWNLILPESWVEPTPYGFVPPAQ